MIIGVVKEIKTQEYRVGAPPFAAGVLAKAGHQVLVETKAGEGSGFSDEEYVKAGATIVKTAKEVWGKAEMIYHVKEPIPSEYPFLRKGLILWTYLHLAAAKELTLVLLEKGVTGVAFETVELPGGSTPCLDPMSEVAGRLAAQMGAQYLGKVYKGCGKLIGGVTGVLPAKVVVLGGGIVGTNAAKVALGMGGSVTMMDIDVKRLRYLSETLHGDFTTLVSNPASVAAATKDADLVIGAVLVKGARAPIVLTKEMVKNMKPGSVIVDVAVDQGGCVETTHATTHDNPVYIVDGVLHYGVANMPGMMPQTATVALANATLPYALKMANKGVREAMKADEALAKGMNVYDGKVTNKNVAEALGLEYTPFKP
ncbi:MAG: alanine dehydrogenase [Dehalococcoidales bacterium]|nr:alanine dehydrogenase [Dehalococcoidales bacterium]